MHIPAAIAAIFAFLAWAAHTRITANIGGYTAGCSVLMALVILLALTITAVLTVGARNIIRDLPARYATAGA